MDKNVLDFGLVRLVESMGSDLSIVRNARVSYDAAWRAGADKGSDERLINYLMLNGHNTPFEAVEISIEVKAPIFVIRQWHRHRTQSYNELSARYRELPNEFYLPELEQITNQSRDNKQMRTETQNPNAQKIQNIMRNQNMVAFDTYRTLLNFGAPRELARTVLPLATYSHMFAKANLSNWFRFLRERLHKHAQFEIRVYAIEIYEILKTIAPVATCAFRKTLTSDHYLPQCDVEELVKEKSDNLPIAYEQINKQWQDLKKFQEPINLDIEMPEFKIGDKFTCIKNSCSDLLLHSILDLVYIENGAYFLKSKASTHYRTIIASKENLYYENEKDESALFQKIKSEGVSK